MSCKRTRCVAHFDVLGFSKLVENDSKKAWDILNQLHTLLSRVPQQHCTVASTNQTIISRCKTVFFSDTLIIYTEQDDFEDMFSVFMSTTNLFFQSMVLFGIPLRGAISHGDFFVDTSKNIYMGLPLVNAYKTGEEAQWLGFVVEDDVYEIISKKMPDLKYDQYFVEWDVPLKDEDAKKRVVVNWPYIFRNSIPSIESARGFYEQFKFNKLFGDYEDLDKNVQHIYENTHMFLAKQMTY